MKRFQDENKTIWSFAEEISVKCPKCTNKASVKRTFNEKYFCYDDFLLECKQCYYKLEKPIYQYIAYGNPYCNSCFKQYKFESQLLKEIPEKHKAKCTHCKNQEEWKPKIKEVLMGFNVDKNKAKDPIYQTELWYQVEFENQLFWAYNLEHITYLEKYIDALLRERNNVYSVFGSSLIARLPKFVKEAKNREKLLKIIKKWKSKS